MVLALIVPTWFKQRQAKAEEAGENIYRVTAPNLPESFVGIRKDDSGLWQGFVRQTKDGSNLEATEPIFTTPTVAWEAAFEIHRRRLVV
jgi:hypothetical protein